MHDAGDLLYLISIFAKMWGLKNEKKIYVSFKLQILTECENVRISSHKQQEWLSFFFPDKKGCD